jgi:Domain of unknown function (DUF4349)
MNTTARARVFRRPPHAATTLIIAAAIWSTGLLLAGCSGPPTAARSAVGGSAAHAAAGSFGTNGTAAAPAPSAAAIAGQPAASQATRLLLSSQSLIQTASMTVRANDVATAAAKAVAIAQASGGYTANEQESLTRGRHASAVVSLQLKIPAAQFSAALSQLSALGAQTAFSQQAQDVTQQVADVGSRVTSAQAAIAQLRALLRRAGSIPSLLGVQDQINAEESSLEELLAQQRTLSRQTTFATVSLLLVSHHPKVVKARKKAHHGFVAGLSAGWRVLRLVVSALLTGLGAALPFALIAGLAGGIMYGGRRRALRRRSRPTAAQ